MMKLKSLSAILAFSLASFSLQAQARVISDYHFYLPENSLTKRLLGKSFNIHIHEPSWTSATPANMQITDLGLDVQGRWLTIEPESSQITLSFAIDSITLTTGKLLVDQIVDVHSDQFIGHFRLNARCENVELKLESPGSVLSGQFQTTDSGDGLTESKVDIALPKVSLVHDSINCTGTSGFSEVLKSQLINLSQQFPEFIRLHQVEILNYLNRTLKSELASSLALDIPGALEPQIAVRIQINSVKIIEEGIWLHGFLDFDLKSLIDEVEPPVLVTFKEEVTRDFSVNLDPKSPTLILPPTLLPKLLEQKFKANHWKLEVPNQDFPAFSKLMSSWWLKFLLWPDLFNFKKTTPFLFQFYSSQDIVVKNSSETGTISIKWPLQLQLYSEEAKRWKPYTQFSILYQANLGLNLTENSFRYSARNSKLSLHNNSDLVIAESTIARELKKVITQQAWPTDILTFSQFKPLGIKISTESFSIQYVDLTP